jgi:predicted AAA+ superfamily ATPase
MVGMRRYLSGILQSDLNKKMVLLTGPRQVGKTTLANEMTLAYKRPQYLNWDLPDDRRMLLDQSWSLRTDLLIFDEIHKMSEWKAYLKGVYDGRSEGQAVLITGSARMDTSRQTGDSLAGRYFPLRLHPFSVREWVELSGVTADAALDRLIERGGMPETFLTENATDADRWRRQYFTDLVREDVLDFHGSMRSRLCACLLRCCVDASELHFP